MRFKNRLEAAEQLADFLKEFSGAPDTIVLGLARGGVPIARRVAEILKLPLDIALTRKLGAPGNEELAIGAITESGVRVMDDELCQTLQITNDYIETVAEREMKTIQQRANTYRAGHSRQSIKNKNVIIVDDGIATGATMLATVKQVLSEGAKKCVVAVPVSSQDSLKKISAAGAEARSLQTPADFYAVAQFYDVFEQVTDDEVVRLLRQ